MRLLTRTTLYYFFISIAVFGIGSLVAYWIISDISDKDLNEFFERREAQTVERIQEGDVPPENKRTRDFIRKLEKAPASLKPTFKDTTFYFGRWETHVRRKSIIRLINGEYYQINIYKSIKETDDELESALYTIFYLFLALLLAMLVLNYFLSRNIWQPFNHTLLEIKRFNLSENRPLLLQQTSIHEFQELNRLVSEMTEKIRNDYQNLKEFTENVSHEVQTPLAVIKNKLEMLIQSPNLNEEQLRLIESAYSSSSKLSKLNKTLTLITKIENQEFSNIQKINLTDLLEKILYNFQEILSLKEIQLSANLSPEIIIPIDPMMADVLITNLVKNAVQHNFPQGLVQVTLHPKQLVIANTGEPLKNGVENMFSRFAKEKKSSDSLGLGLAIVKKICEVNRFSIQYVYQEDLHIFTVQFS
jgi:signal transduction histidine kinase